MPTVALVQVGLLMARRRTGDAIARAADDTQIKRALGAGSAGDVAIAVLIALLEIHNRLDEAAIVAGGWTATQLPTRGKK